MRWVLAGLALSCLAGASARAGPADVVEATGSCDAEDCRLVVTVRHDDEGWQHYADAWQVVGPDGAVLATRVLRHPHVGEQPFTRDLRGVRIARGVEKVRIRARDSVHGLGGREVEVTLERGSAD